MVFQSYALYPYISVYDNMPFGLSLRKTPKKEIERFMRRKRSIKSVLLYSVYKVIMGELWMIE